MAARMATKMVSTGDYCVVCTTIHGLRKTMTEQQMADYNLVCRIGFLCVVFFLVKILFFSTAAHMSCAASGMTASAVGEW